MSPQGRRHDSTGLALRTLLAPLAWGTTYITITEFLPADRPLFVALIRVLPAGLLLAVVGSARSRWRPHRREWLHLAVLSLFNFGLFFPLLIAGIYRLPGGVAASVGGVQPLLVGLVTWAVTRVRMRRFDVAVGVIAAIGVAMVVVRPGADVSVTGVLAALAANVSFSIGVVATKHLPAPPDRLAATGWQLLLATIFLAPLALVVEGPPPALTFGHAAGFAYLSLVATGMAFVLWFLGIQRLPTQAPPVLGLAAPLTGAALGWAVLQEDLTLLQIAGFVITVGAITYAATAGSRVSQPPKLGRDLDPDQPVVRGRERERAGQR